MKRIFILSAPAILSLVVCSKLWAAEPVLYANEHDAPAAEATPAGCEQPCEHKKDCFLSRLFNKHHDCCAEPCPAECEEEAPCEEEKDCFLSRLFCKHDDCCDEPCPAECAEVEEVPCEKEAPCEEEAKDCCKPGLFDGLFRFRSCAWTWRDDCHPCDEPCEKEAPCEPAAQPCCDHDSAKIAEAIDTLKTGCDEGKRRKAADRLGRYDCCCHPEIAPALAEALSDCSADVRAEAADSLGDLGCCDEATITALENAMGDCDGRVREEARESLEKCGVVIVECDECPKCGGCGDCGSCQCGSDGGALAPAEELGARAPAELVPAPQAYSAPLQQNNPQTQKKGLLDLLRIGTTR